MASISLLMPQPRWVTAASAGAGALDSGGGGDGNGWSGGGSGGSGRGGGGGGGGDGKGEGDSSPQRGGASGLFLWQGWADRVAADPEFPFKVMLEQVIGVGASVIGDMSSRPNWGLNELDFVFATLVVGSIVNFALMYLLAPTASAAAGGAAGRSLLVRALSDEFLVKWGAPGAGWSVRRLAGSAAVLCCCRVRLRATSAVLLAASAALSAPGATSHTNIT
jgi:Protein RETICULATA-related